MTLGSAEVGLDKVRIVFSKSTTRLSGSPCCRSSQRENSLAMIAPIPSSCLIRLGERFTRRSDSDSRSQLRALVLKSLRGHVSPALVAGANRGPRARGNPNFCRCAAACGRRTYRRQARTLSVFCLASPAKWLRLARKSLKQDSFLQRLKSDRRLLFESTGSWRLFRETDALGAFFLVSP